MVRRSRCYACNRSAPQVTDQTGLVLRWGFFYWRKKSDAFTGERINTKKGSASGGLALYDLASDDRTTADGELTLVATGTTDPCCFYVGRFFHRRTVGGVFCDFGIWCRY